MDNPLKISIVTPVFNAQSTIRQTVESVLQQKYEWLEYIIVDGQSTDGTLSILEEYKDNPQVTLISEKDNGIYDAMNKGIKRSSGDIIGIINADDYYLPGVFEKVAQTFIRHNAGIVYGNLMKVKEISEQQYIQVLTPDISKMPRTMGIFHPSTFVAKQVYQDIGMFDTRYRLAADYDFLLRAYNANITFRYLNETIAAFRVGGASNISCDSYKEAIEILTSHKSKHTNEMKQLHRKCLLKKELKQMMNSIVNVFGLKALKKQYLKRKWRK